MVKELISERIGIRRRYVRAVDILRDLEDSRALEGYVLTPSVRDGLRRVLTGLETGSSQRAFRVTGPYGSGKSSFGLLLATLFQEGTKGGPATDLTRDLTGGQDVPTYRPLVMVGQRASLVTDLATAVRDVARIEFGESNGMAMIAEWGLDEEDSAVEKDVKTVLDCLVSCSERLYAESGRGLLLLIDEMGRYVEFAVSNPGQEDSSVFQQLAERAGGLRSNKLAVVGFMHHRFSDYMATLSDWLEGEWRRSSERYEEIVFHESHEQLLYLLSEALVTQRAHSRTVKTAARSQYREAGSRGLFTLANHNLLAVGERLYPFHPAALACLWSSSRRFGQNERSIFALLQSSEPFGYQEFAHRTCYDSKNWYRVVDVYDYLASQGSLRFQSKDREKRWEMGQDALLVCSDMPVEAQRVLKVVSLIAVLEPVPGLSAEIDTLVWLLGCDKRVVSEVLVDLEKRGVIHRRESQGDWSLWSHSSVDLDRWMEKAKVAVPEIKRLDDELSQVTSLRPMVAQRHYHRTGTLRSFTIQIGKKTDGADSRADGLIMVQPTYPDEEPEWVKKEATLFSKRLGPLAVIRLQPISPVHLALARNLACWRWVRTSCEELRIDDFARAEVERRIRDLENELRGCLLPFGQTNTDTPGVGWWHEGQIVQIDSRAGLNRFLSDVCDRTFDNAPILRNELINREKLSSAVAAARMRLLGLMLDKEDKAFLGLTGAPPERSIYLSMFLVSGLHRQIGNQLQFLAPRQDDQMGWGPAWRRVDDMVKGDESVGVDTVISKLAEPPIGLRSGPALLLIAAYMLCHRSSTALMERGTFQPDITQAHFMRLAKSPKNFALRRVGVIENKKILESLVDGLTILSDERPGTEVKEIVEALYRWWNCVSEFARSTQTVGPIAQNVRTVLRKAKEPIELLFHQLPLACEAVEADGINIEQYMLQLDMALTELDEALPILRSQVQASILQAFGTRTINELRSQIALDYEDHQLELGSYELRAFVGRTLKDDIDNDAWIDGVAGLVVGKRLESWNDMLVDHFAFEIQGIAQKLARRLALIRERNARSAPVTAIHLTSSDGRERSLFLREGEKEEGVREDSPLKVQIRNLLSQTERPDAVLLELIGELIEMKTRESMK